MKAINKTQFAHMLILTLDGNILEHCGNSRHVRIGGKEYEWYRVTNIPTDIGIPVDVCDSSLPFPDVDEQHPIEVEFVA